MKYINKIIGGAVISMLATSAQAIIVTTENDANTLANYLSGSGITISNAQYSGGNFAAGTFSDGFSSGVGIDSGVVLSSGSAASIEGPNNSSSTTQLNGTSGLSNLTALSGSKTYDATSLSFDFQFDGDAGGDLSFNFVFGSEEYNEFVGSSFNDVFAFYVDGVNLAELPDGSPVAINNVNNHTNSSLFVDNTAGTFDIEANGFTTVLGFDLFGLDAGSHNLSFQIADAGDSAWNSWLLIEANAFGDKAKQVPELSASSAPISALLLAGLLALGIERKRKRS